MDTGNLYLYVITCDAPATLNIINISRSLLNVCLFNPGCLLATVG